ncbi:MAG: hypothetical protein V3R81_04650 [Gammaproteobacteria bacterium]
MAVRLLLGCFALLSMQPIAAEVVDVSAAGFKLRFEIRFEQPASTVYQTILDLESWWDPDHTYSGDAANLKLDLKPGGCLCEYWDGGAVEHLRVGYVKENSSLRLLGGLGPLQSMAVSGAMSFAVANVDGGSRFVFVYEVGGYTPGGVEAIAKPVDEVWAGHLARFEIAVNAHGG